MTRATIIWLVACAAGVVAIIWAAIAWSPAGPATPTTVADPSTLPGISSATLAASSTWPVELDHLAARLAADGLAPQTMEGEVLHIHQHLDLFVHGAAVAVPANIGINEAAGWLSTIHVHDDTGVIHVESPVKGTFTLGEFFDIWGVTFTKDCLGGYCAGADDALQVYVNGALYTGDPRTLALAAHQEIAIVFGTPAEAPAHIPGSYAFPAGE